MKLLYANEEIQQRIEVLGKAISEHYPDGNLVVIGVLKGCFIFMADLLRHVDVPLELDFAKLSSYGDSDSPQHEVKILADISIDIAGKHVLIVDDICDTGRSLKAYKEHLEQRGPASVELCTMIDKTHRRDSAIEPNFYGFRIDEGFIVGYGLDYAEQYRQLPHIYTINPT